MATAFVTERSSLLGHKAPDPIKVVPFKPTAAQRIAQEFSSSIYELNRAIGRFKLSPNGGNLQAVIDRTNDLKICKPTHLFYVTLGAVNEAQQIAKTHGLEKGAVLDKAYSDLHGRTLQTFYPKLSKDEAIENLYNAAKNEIEAHNAKPCRACR
jgi:hypothetical protein